jgi:hypothetical protein
VRSISAFQDMDKPVTNLVIREVMQADASPTAAFLTQLGYPSSTAGVTTRLAYWQADQ